MKFLFCGDRNWADRNMIRTVMEKLESVFGDFEVIEGEANGADSLSKSVALDLGKRVLAFPANWERFGRAAGPIRNAQMLTEGRPDAVLAFHPNIEESTGTRNMVEQAVRSNIPVWITYRSDPTLKDLISALQLLRK